MNTYAVRGAQRQQQLDHRGLHRDIKRGGDFVADYQRRPAREGASDGDALLLPARELVGVAKRGIGGQASLLQQAWDLGQAAAEQAQRPSQISPTRCRGFSEESGFWKMICTALR